MEGGKSWLQIYMHACIANSVPACTALAVAGKSGRRETRKGQRKGEKNLRRAESGDVLEARFHVDDGQDGFLGRRWAGWLPGCV